MAESANARTASWASSDAVRTSMRGNRGRDTAPELAVRTLLHAAGRRYRVNVRPLPSLRRTADIVFTRAHLAVFIDGCFWHGCPLHYQRPATHSDYWDAKLAGNRARDADTAARLVAAGWSVLRFWEHDDPAAVAAAVGAAVDAARAAADRAAADRGDAAAASAAEASAAEVSAM